MRTWPLPCFRSSWSCVSLLGVLLSPYIVALMAPGFMKEPDKFALTVLLTKIMFPYIFFISLVALCMGILNSLRHFAAPALSPVVLNISMIAAALFLRDFFAEPILALSVGVMVGGLLQLGMQVPALLQKGVRLRPDYNFRHPGVKRIGALMVPAAFGAAVYQINIFISTLIASFLPGGSVSFLYYADRVVELPLGVFAIAIGTASLPSLSDQVSQGQVRGHERDPVLLAEADPVHCHTGDHRPHWVARADHIRPLPEGRLSTARPRS